MYGNIRGVRVLTPQAAPDAGLLARIADLAASGHIAPIIDRRFRLEDAADAIRYMEVHHASG